jgi:hypothetical protein
MRNHYDVTITIKKEVSTKLPLQALGSHLLIIIGKQSTTNSTNTYNCKELGRSRNICLYNLYNIEYGKDYTFYMHPLQIKHASKQE